ncbi:VOC family protein [Xylanimonas oleitrophica]|uniref:VOC family protein n=1 Tax=Xylanimonas oleitrophica TaxID=2607479 RepID=A0A2W5WP37_9MICO|nr:VOC family protein [Xylanimonas oleitrophica]PZR53319.1 VOC family protein [Xylanimonas oleitrophica]
MTPLVTFHALAIDAVDASALAAFWARTLGLRAEQPDGGAVALHGKQPGQTVWVNPVPEPKTVKQRVHLDVRARSLDDLPGSPRLTEPGQYPWTVLADPEGGELCVFTYEDVADYRLKDVVVDCADPGAVARWWHGLWGGELGHDAEHGWWWIDGAAGVPFESFDFGPVPEPKTVKNRIHWDVELNPGVTVADLVAYGARVVREPDDEIRWTVMADPEGNEFCVFSPGVEEPPYAE